MLQLEISWILRGVFIRVIFSFYSCPISKSLIFRIDYSLFTLIFSFVDLFADFSLIDLSFFSFYLLKDTSIFFFLPVFWTYVIRGSFKLISFFRQTFLLMSSDIFLIFTDSCPIGFGYYLFGSPFLWDYPRFLESALGWRIILSYLWFFVWLTNI